MFVRQDLRAGANQTQLGGQAQLLRKPFPLRSGVVLLSGDRHLAEVMKLEPEEAGIGYPLYEVTSSSLNAPSGNLREEKGQVVLQQRISLSQLQPRE